MSYDYKDGTITYSDGTSLSCDILLDRLTHWKQEYPEYFAAWLDNNSMTEEEARQKIRSMFNTLEEEKQCPKTLYL